MEVPRTNQEVFTALPDSTTTGKGHMYNNQCNITKAAVAMAKCTDQIIDICKHMKSDNGIPPPNLDVRISLILLYTNLTY